MSDSNDQTASAAGISLHELRLINIGLHCVKGKVGTDIDKFTKMAGYKSNSVASATWSRVKRHLQKVVPVVEPEENDDAEEPKGDMKKRKRAAKAKKADDGSGDEASPSKKQARGKKAQRDESVETAHESNTEKDESGDQKANEANTKKTRVKKAAKVDDAYDADDDDANERTASPSMVKDGATPEDDEPVTLECITVKGSDDEAGPSIKKGSKTAQKGKAGAVKGGKAKVEAGKYDSSDDDQITAVNEKPKKRALASKGKGKNDDSSDEDAPTTKSDKKKNNVAVRGKAKAKAVHGSDDSDYDIDNGKTKGAAKASNNKCAATGNRARQTKSGKTASGKASKKVNGEGMDSSDDA